MLRYLSATLHQQAAAAHVTETCLHLADFVTSGHALGGLVPPCFLPPPSKILASLLTTYSTPLLYTSLHGVMRFSAYTLSMNDRWRLATYLETRRNQR